MTGRALCAVLLLAGSVSKESPVADLFTTNFSTDTHPYYQWVQSGTGQWPEYGAWNYPDWEASNPNLYVGTYVSVYDGEGKGGVKKGLWCYTNYDTGYLPVDASAGWVLNGPFYDHSPLVPAEYIAGATVSFSIKFKDEAFNYFEDFDYWPTEFTLIEIFPPGAGYSLDVYLQDESEGADDWSLWVVWEYWDGRTTPVMNSASYHIGSHTNLIDSSWHDFVLTYKPSTVTMWDPSPGTGGVHEEADGWITLTDTGTTLIDQQDIHFTINGYGYGPDHTTRGEANVNRPRTIAVSGLAGAYDLISYGPLVVETWVDVANFIDQDLDSHDFLNGEVRVLIDLWSGKSGAAVKARLYNVTDGISVGESIEVASTGPTDASFTAALTLGLHTYRLQVTCDTPRVDIFCIGQIEII